MRNNILRSDADLSWPTAAPPLALLGSSAAAARARAAIAEASAGRTPVLLLCEAGCRPRELAAALHEISGNTAAFLTVDCGAADPARLDRLLFGTVRPRPMPQDLEVLGDDAALLSARGGTLFIESIGDMPNAAQRRLARVLRDGEVRTAGSRGAVPVTCRLVASAGRELQADVRGGGFRADLHRRLGAGAIVIPPLRERPEDLGAVVAGLLPEVDAGTAGPRSFTGSALTVLASLPWTENIDELAEALRRILRHSDRTVVRQEEVLAHLPLNAPMARPDLTVSLRDARSRFEREYISAVLERHQWRMSEAARALGIERANLYRKTRQLGITRASRVEQT